MVAAFASTSGNIRLPARQVEALVRAWKIGRTGPSPPATTLPSSPIQDPDQVRLEQAVANLLGTPIALRCDAKDLGELMIVFDSLEILDGILEKMGYSP